MSRIGISTCVAMGCLLLVTGAKSQTTESPGNSAGKDQPAVTNVPRLIQFSGVVKDGKGDPLGLADVRLTFSVYEQQQGGAALWTESQVVGLDDQGRYAVLLGVTQSRGVPLELFPAGKSRWLGLQVETREEEPRVLIVSVPYALKAEDAEKLGGKRASDFVLAEQLDEKLRTAVSVSVVPEAAAAPTGKAPAAAGGTPKSQSATNFVDGNATQVVSVQQNGTGDALTALTLSTTSGKAGVRGQATGATGQTFGVQGTTASNAGTGVSGLASATTGSTVGVRGQVNSANGIAGAFLTTNTGGKILSGRAGAAGTEKFSVDGAGNVRAYGYLDLLGNPFPGTGTVRSVASGTGLTGGPITSSGTLSLDTNFTDARYATQTALTAEAIARTNADLTLDAAKVSKAGDTMTGPLNLPSLVASSGTTDTGTAVISATQTGGQESPDWFGPAAVVGNAGNAIGVRGQSSDFVGVYGEGSMGVVGHGHGADGVGVTAYGTGYEGSTTGVFAAVRSPGGTAGIFSNIAGGAILRGSSNGAEVFRVDANGVYANAYHGDGSGLTNLNVSSATHAATADFATTAGSATTAENANNATTAQTAAAATMATEAMNAAALGGTPAVNFAQLSANNVFGADQTIHGNLDVSGTGSFVNTSSSFEARGVVGRISGGNDGAGVYGEAAAGTATSGVYGVNDSAEGAALRGDERSETGNTAGIHATVRSFDGAAGSFHNVLGGRILSGWKGDRDTAIEVFRVEGSGDVWTAGKFIGDGSGLTGILAHSSLDAEAAARAAQDDALQTQLNSESAARNAADTTEADARATAVSLLQGAISALPTSGANTFSGTQTIASGDLSLANGKISLPESSSATAGVINLGGSRFIHSFPPSKENTFVGGEAGNFTSTGADNTASGYQTLSSNTTGFYNTASGVRALLANTTGYYNVASGASALGSNTEGHNNDASGVAALYYNTTGFLNTASGNQSLTSNTTGAGNTAAGAGSLFFNTTGEHNTAVGMGSGGVNSTGSYNTSIGYEAGPNWIHSDLSYTTAIGAGAVVSQSHSLILGGTGDYAVNVGIGTPSPGNILTIVQGSTSQPIADAWTTYSSRRWKTNIQTIQAALATVERLRGVTYDSKADGQHSIGVIAEEVGEVLPEVVAYEANGVDAKSVDYARLTALLIEAVKEQQVQIRDLKAQIEQLKERRRSNPEIASR